MSSRKATIIVYHYVRNIRSSRYPEIKGLELELFRSQLDYLQAYYTFITIEDLIQAIEDGTALPSKAVLLTFNDSYADHFQNVFPLLVERDIQGCFYPEIAAIEEDKVLINHKIHYILACVKDSNRIKHYIFSLLDKYRGEYNLNTNSYYYDKLANASVYDSRETVFVKRILQLELPEKLRHTITDELFDHFVGIEEKVFAKELYLNRKQIKCMIDHGMHFGILGYHHRRYDTLSREEQQKEITYAKEAIIEMGEDNSYLSMSYPWGAYNQDTIDILSDIKCKVAFTGRAGIADLSSSPVLELPRLDTNEIPKSKEATPNHWYAEA